MRECLVCGRPFKEPAGRGRPRETCSPECQAARRRQQRQQSRKRAYARGCPAHMHGTSTGYTFFGCTCVKCRKWAREYKQNRRTAIREARQ